MALIGSVIMVLGVIVDLVRRRRHTRRVRRTPSSVLVGEVRRQLRNAAPGAEALVVPDDVGTLSVDMIKEIAADEGLTFRGGVRPWRNAPLHLRFRSPSGAAARIVAAAVAPRAVEVEDRPVALSSPTVALATDPARPTAPPVSPAVDRLLNVVVATGAVVVLPLGLLLVPEIRGDSALLVPLLVVSVLAVGPFVWSVVRVRTAWRLRAAHVAQEERRAEHPFLAYLRDAEPDRHRVLAVDLTAHPDLDAETVEAMVVTAGWDVVSGEERTLFLCRPRPRPSRRPVHIPDPPPQLPPGIQARYRWALLVVIAGVTTLAFLRVFDDVRVGVAIGVLTTLVGIGSYQWAGVVRRRRAAR